MLLLTMGTIGKQTDKYMFTAYLHKGLNRHTPESPSAANILNFASQKIWVHSLHYLQVKTEMPPFLETMYIVFNLCT